jgi:hypothetical protein
MRPWLAALAVTVVASPAAAATSLHTVHVDDFSLSVPTEWRTLTRVGTVRLMTAAQIPQNGFYVNANVVVTPDASGPPTYLRAALLMNFKRAGINVTSLFIGHAALPAGSATTLRYRGTMNGRRLRWLAYVVHAHGRAYVLTFTDGERAFPSHAGLFAAMAQSFRIS